MAALYLLFEKDADGFLRCVSDSLHGLTPVTGYYVFQVEMRQGIWSRKVENQLSPITQSFYGQKKITLLVSYCIGIARARVSKREGRYAFFL